MKILSILFCIMLSVTANAQQIFSHITKLDKFDDVVWEKNLKTIITFNDPIITIETKGQEPECYYYKDNDFLAVHDGSSDSIINLVSDVWGYEDVYNVVNTKDCESLLQEFEGKLEPLLQKIGNDTIPNEDESRAFAKELLNFRSKMISITFRHISEHRYFWNYKTKVVWVMQPDGSRVIYKP